MRIYHAFTKYAATDNTTCNAINTSKPAHQTQQFEHMTIPEHMPIAELIQLSKYYNGFTREKAVQLLGQSNDAQAFPALIVRLNDWVPQVRSAAGAAIVRLIHAVPAHDAVLYLHQFEDLLKKTRVAHQPFIDQIYQQLLEKDPNVLEWGCAQKTHPKSAYCCFKYLLSNYAAAAQSATPPNPPHWLVKGLRTKHQGIAHLAIDFLLTHPLLPLEQLLELVINAPVPYTRTTILRHCIKQQHHDAALQIAKRLLFHPNIQTQALAAFYLQQYHAPAFTQCLEQAYEQWQCPQTPSITLVLLRLLHKTTPYTHTLQEAFKHPTAKVRRYALLQAFMQDPKQAEQYLNLCLLDPDMRVQSTVLEVAKKRIASPSFSQIQQYLTRNTSQKHVLLALKILQYGNVWDMITVCLTVNTPNHAQSTSAVDQSIRHIIQQLVHERIRHVYATPSTEQRARLEHAIMHSPWLKFEPELIHFLKAFDFHIVEVMP